MNIDMTREPEWKKKAADLLSIIRQISMNNYKSMILMHP